MASAQVLPNSRKQEHLEAGKRRLEEFRKKKAADRAKKTATTSQNQPSATISDQKQPVVAGNVRVLDSDEAGTSVRLNGIVEPFVSTSDGDSTVDVTERVEQNPMNDADANPPPMNDYSASIADLVWRHTSNHDLKSYGSSGLADVNHNKETEEINTDSRIYAGSQGNSIQPSDNLRVSSLENEQEMHGSVRFNDTVNSGLAERNFSGLASGFSRMRSIGGNSFESTGFNSDVLSSSNHASHFPASSESKPQRSRASFLDSLNETRTPSGMSFQRTEPENESSISNASKSNGMDVLGTSPFPRPMVETETVGPFSKSRPSHAPGSFENSMNFSMTSSNGIDPLRSNVNENSMERRPEFYAPKQDEGFAALEQHIEDLTQEKFSLQRALEASRALAESLAAENSSLTDSYNQQRSVLNQLKSDMEKLQEEIKVHLVGLESVKIECANAQLECNAADERAKLLASEVIGLEEKALRLRSNELKLERDLENSHVEITSYKKKISSLERERQDLQLTISALQEEKKLLQSKIRKASSGKSTDISRSPTNKKDMATSTEDLDAIPDNANQETLDTASLIGNETSSLHLLVEGLESNLEGSSTYIPPDQMRMIQNINILISELALEKEELVKALASESSQCSKLKDLNKELSHKLEAQTQRLELLAAQSMVNENIPARLPDSRTMQEIVTYADEGDEVVERVLGWIMKLFPGGPSRRRTSKLL